jgi:hypothetical protein
MLRTCLLSSLAAVYFLAIAAWNIAAEPDSKPVDASKLTKTKRAELYLSQLPGLKCHEAYTSEGHQFEPFVGVVAGELDENPPTVKLAKLGMAAVPLLIKALDDETPTKSVESSIDGPRVWLVSDFAWVVLRQTLQRDFTDDNIYHRSPTSIPADQRKLVYQRMKDWYEKHKDLSHNEMLLTYFDSPKPGDWFTAGKHFAAKKDKRAVSPLVAKLSVAKPETKGYLCKLVGEFQDPSTQDPLRQVLATAEDPFDRAFAALALGNLGDTSGVPAVVDYLSAKKESAKEQNELIWFLMHVHTPEAIAGLNSLVLQAEPRLAEEILWDMHSAIEGLANGQPVESAGSVEILPVLLAAMNRPDSAERESFGLLLSIRDRAIAAFLLLKDGTDYGLYGDEPTDDLFAPKALLPEPQGKQLAIDLQTWYETNRPNLRWDTAKKRLVMKGE